MYNTTNLTSITYSYELLAYANEVTGQTFMGALVVTIFIILLMTLTRREDFVDATITSGWVSFIVSLFFLAMGMLNFKVSLIFLLLTGLMAFFKVFSK